MDDCYIIFNGPSSERWIGYDFQGPVFGCNFAYRDFPLTACFAVDRLTVAAIRSDNPPKIKFYTKKSSLELPPGWYELPTPGIDSGSFALEYAYMVYPQYRKVVIGADGILNQDHSTRYEYRWRNKTQPHPKTHQRHRTTILELVKQYQQPTVFISDILDQDLETLDYGNYVREKNMEMDGQ